MRNLWRRYIEAQANETSMRFSVLLGIEWVVSTGVVVAILFNLEGLDPAPSRVAFYEIAAALIPTLLFVYLSQHRAMTTSIARGNKKSADLLLHADLLTEEMIEGLKQGIERGDHLLATGRAVAARNVAIAATGEIIALSVVSNGASTTFSIVAVGFALLTTGATTLTFAVERLGRPDIA